MLRKTNVILTLGIAVILKLLLILFLDPLLKYAIIRTGETAIGAKVEIGKVRTKLLQGKITIEHVAIANPHEPFQNLITWDKATFKVMPGQLLQKKVVIPEASVSALAWGTPRQTSGALPKKEKKDKEEKPSLVAKKFEELFGASKSFGLERLSSIKSDASVEDLKPENLSSLKTLDDGNQKLESASAAWQKDLSQLNLESKIADLRKEIASLKEGGFDIKTLPAKAKKTKEIQSAIKELQKNTNDLKSKAQKDIEEAQSLLAKAKESKNKDLANLTALAGLPSLDTEAIAKMLLGPMVYQKAHQAIYWAKLAKEHLPTKSEKPPKEKPRARRAGLDIEFPGKVSYPAFLLVHAEVSGDGFKAEARGITSNPALYGKPLTFNVDGAKDGLTMKITGNLDHHLEKPQDEVEIKWDGLKLQNIALGKSGELGANLASAKTKLGGKVLYNGEIWSGQFNLQANSVVLEPQINSSSKIVQKLGETLRSVKNFNVDLAFAGKEENMDIHFKSDIGNTLAKSLKGMLDTELAGHRKKLEDKINALYNEKAKAFESNITGKKSGILAPLNKYNDQLRDLLTKAVPSAGSDSNSPSPLKNFKKLFKY